MKTRESHIVRIDIEKPKSQHCWEVKIIRGKKPFHRTFSDSKFGGREGALAAAIKCRNEEIKNHPALNSYEQAIRPKRTNRSGIVGVRWGKKVVKRGHNIWEYDAWIATGTPESGGPSKTRYFLPHLFGGKRKALVEAISQRQACEKSLKASVEEKLGKSESRVHG